LPPSSLSTPLSIRASCIPPPSATFRRTASLGAEVHRCPKTLGSLQIWWVLREVGEPGFYIPKVDKEGEGTGDVEKSGEAERGSEDDDGDEDEDEGDGDEE
jgi:hypothetical protein